MTDETSEFKAKPINLAEHAASNVQNAATKAANIAFEMGLTPKQQLQAARAASGQKLQYTSHFGTRQQERAFRKMQAKKDKDNGRE